MEHGRCFFVGIAVVVSAFLVKLIRDTRHQGDTLAYCLILGGAIGNLIDRIFRSYVVDYLDFHWQSWHWPAFNLADIAIVIGVLLIFATSLLGEKPDPDPDRSA